MVTACISSRLWWEDDLARMLVSKILAVAGIALVLLSMVNSAVHVGTVASPRSVIHDTTFIAAMGKISDLVPTGRVIVVSTNGPFVTYFTGHIAKVPFGVSSRASLVQYMKKNQYDYLLVFEGSSQVPELVSLFSSKGIKELEDSYERIQTFRTDFSTIDLFRLRTLA